MTFKPKSRNLLAKSKPKSSNKEDAPQPEKPQAEAGEQVITNGEDNPLYYNVFLNQLSLSLVKITGKYAPMQAAKLFSSMKITGLLNPGLLSIYYCFVSERALTPRLIEDSTGISNPTVYRVLRKLQKLGLITQIAKTRRGNIRGGPKSTIYALIDHTADDIQRCVEKEGKRVTPIYSLTVNVGQAIIDDYLEPNSITQYSRRDVIKYLGKYAETKNFHKGDIADQVCAYLHNAGYKIWM